MGRDMGVETVYDDSDASRDQFFSQGVCVIRGTPNNIRRVVVRTRRMTNTQKSRVTEKLQQIRHLSRLFGTLFKNKTRGGAI